MTGKTLRFINFLADSLIFLCLLLVFMFLFRNFIAVENMKWIGIILYFLYYFISEYASGTTPGKMITRSKVSMINDNHDYLFIKIALRTITRLIVIDTVSYLFTYRGLHDLVSMTTIKKVDIN